MKTVATQLMLLYKMVQMRELPGKGQFIEGYYIVGLLAEALLVNESCEKIIRDPRLTWNTINLVERNSGIPVMCKTGHASIKERMRDENAMLVRYGFPSLF